MLVAGSGKSVIPASCNEASAPECFGGLEMGVAVTHLIAEPGVSSPLREPILQACDAR
jgi:hypothetical protein